MVHCTTVEHISAKGPELNMSTARSTCYTSDEKMANEDLDRLLDLYSIEHPHIKIDFDLVLYHHAYLVNMYYLN